jgi:hypothetical protein
MAGFLRLVSNMLTAGYLEDWRWHATLSGAPQGGVASPVLSNIYLDRLDRFVEQSLLPDYNRGRLRRRNTEYQAVDHAIAKAKRHGDRAAVKTLRRQRRTLPSQDPNDPDYRRLRYVRYCVLCRRRHKIHYADLRIMPMSLVDPLCGKGFRLARSAQSIASAQGESRRQVSCPSSLASAIGAGTESYQRVWPSGSRWSVRSAGLGWQGRSRPRHSDYADLSSTKSLPHKRFHDHVGIIRWSA